MRRGAGVDDGDDDDSWGVISNTDQERVSFERVDMAILTQITVMSRNYSTHMRE